MKYTKEHKLIFNIIQDSELPTLDELQKKSNLSAEKLNSIIEDLEEAGAVGHTQPLSFGPKSLLRCTFYVPQNVSKEYIDSLFS
ncbi:MAG: hypothetical protein ACI4PZ_03010 [Akkermansia sp.]